MNEIIINPSIRETRDSLVTALGGILEFNSFYPKESANELYRLMNQYISACDDYIEKFHKDLITEIDNLK